jgi:hypothetical protein
MSPYSRFSALKERAAANGITAKQFDEVHNGFHETAIMQPWGASEDTKNYMEVLRSCSVLRKLIPGD